MYDLLVDTSQQRVNNFIKNTEIFFLGNKCKNSSNNVKCNQKKRLFLAIKNQNDITESIVDILKFYKVNLVLEEKKEKLTSFVPWTQSELQIDY